MATLPQPVDRFGPLRISCQLPPPSVVLYSPRSAESLHRLPGTQAYTVPAERGSTMILEMRSEFPSPAWVQVSPASVDL